MRCRQQLGAYHAKNILKKETVALTSREAFWFPVESSNFKWGRDHLFKHNRQQQQCTLLTQQRRNLFLRDILPPRGISSRVKTWTGYWNLILVINIPTMRLEGSRLWPELFSFMPQAEVQCVVCTTERVIGCQLPPENQMHKAGVRRRADGTDIYPAHSDNQRYACAIMIFSQVYPYVHNQTAAYFLQCILL